MACQVCKIEAPVPSVSDRHPPNIHTYSKTKAMKYIALSKTKYDILSFTLSV